MPYYAGGPAGPLVLTITISTEASPLPLQQDSTEPTVPVSLPKGELLIIEEPSVPLSRTEAPGDRKLTVPASNENKSTPTVFESTATSLPTEGTTPARLTSPPPEIARSSTPSALRPGALAPAKPVKRSTSRRIVLLGLVGLVIVALGSGIAWLTLSHPSPTVVTSTTPTGVTPTAPTGVITEFPIPIANSVPDGITAGPDGNLWFTEITGKIGRISPSGSITEFSISTAQSGPIGIAAGPDGNLWFTEHGGDKIGRISPSGSITEFPIPIANSVPDGITAGPDGNLWFTENDGNKIGRITSGK